MKDLKLINTIALLIPIIISCFALFETDVLLIAIVSLSVTGFLQISTSLIFLFRKPKNYFNIIYIILVILFSISLKFTESNEYFYTSISILCLYFSLLIYSQKQ